MKNLTSKIGKFFSELATQLLKVLFDLLSKLFFCKFFFSVI